MLAVTAAAALMGTANAMIWAPTNPKNSMWYAKPKTTADLLPALAGCPVPHLPPLAAARRDTWLYTQPDQAGVPKYYMNYLSGCDASCNGPVGGMWNGVGATVGSDGVHWKDEGVVIHKDPKAVWLGSGSVLKNTAGEYIMNFSEEYDCAPAKPGAPYGTGCQSIFFAKSKDRQLASNPPLLRMIRSSFLTQIACGCSQDLDTHPLHPTPRQRH